MNRFIVRSCGALSSPLRGTVTVAGAKNSALKLMAATLLAPGRSVVTNVPRISDIAAMAGLLERLGCRVSMPADGPDGSDDADGPDRLDGDEGTVVVEAAETPTGNAPYEQVRRLRASIAVLGPLAARCERASVALPGGDAIGSRGLDMHLSGLTDLGASVRIEHGQVVVERRGRLRGTRIALDFPSVGATENLLMASVLARGSSVIENVAREPEVVDLCRMLQEMGAQIDGVGSSTLVVDGVEELRPVEHRTVGDRIVAGTWAFAACIAGGEVAVEGVSAAYLDIVLDKLGGAGARITTSDHGFTVGVEGRLRALQVATLPYPGFPTDLQPFVLALAAVAEGVSMVTENVFEARFMFAQELARLGADLRLDGHHAAVRGREQLSGAPVTAHDIRAGAALVLAGLAAEGTTEVRGGHHIDRGYPSFEAVLTSLGADVTRRRDD